MTRLFVSFVLFCIPFGAFSFPVIINPSFEEDVFNTFPGYIEGNGGFISGWTVAAGSPGHGLWHQDDGAWANNGQMSDEQGYQYLFFQGFFNTTGAVSQVVHGFAPGRKYKLFFDYNARDWPEIANPDLKDANTLKYPHTAPKGTIWITLGDQEIFRNANVFAVEPAMFHTKPWYEGESIEFTATQTEYDLKISITLNLGTHYVDFSPTLDNFRFIQTVIDPNTPPIVPEIPDQEAAPGMQLAVPIQAIDTNEPPQNLTYTLISGPESSYVDGNTFYWTPEAFDPGPIPVKIRVTDDGEGNLYTERSFNIVMDVLRITSIHVSGGEAILTWTARIGRNYQVQQHHRLGDPEPWTVVANVFAESEEITHPVPVGTSSQLFFRLELLP